MVSVGIGGAVTGRRANVLIFDDPYKNAEDANSAGYRKRVVEFFNSAAYTRMTPDGAIIVILTRWHEDDIVGTLEQSEADGGEHWERVNLPAIAEENDLLGRKPGEPLWPERWPLSALERIRKQLGTYRWNSLYAQRPTAPEGNYFKRAWFAEIIDPNRVPFLERVVRAWDLAATVEGENGNSDPDWLAGCKMGITPGRPVYYILDMKRDRTTPEGVRSLITQTASLDGVEVAVRIEQEGAASGKIVKEYYERLLDGFDCRFETVPRASKYTRSGPFNAACERGDVKLVRGDWNAAFIEELAGFPTGSHDDQVDAAVGCYSSDTLAENRINFSSRSVEIM
jgi:predicted phage terminase large subunit-like protein